ncbi:MAG: LCP family protein [Anaerovoracaceae bacterium]|nr:LCP family protein [Anaerovoracaceae bacterium]
MLLILGLILLIIEVAFISMLFILSVLPTVYTIIIMVMLVALTLLSFKLLSCRKKDAKQRKIGVILSIVMIIALAIGCFYLFTTYSALSRMSDEDVQYEDFYVVGLKDGSYRDVDDIKGETIYVHSSTSLTYDDAQDKLKKEADVNFNETGGYIQLKSVLIGDDGKKNDKLIFLSSNNHEIICENIEGFEKDTRIVHTVSVKIGNKDIAKRVGITKQPFNVYISGIDTFGGIDKVSRSDVNMIMTVDPVDKEILLTSIPRDMYVTLHSYGALDKLTHSGIYGIGETVETVEDWLDIDINYYIRVNFTSVEDIVNAIGGIDVFSEYAFETHGRQNRGYSFVAGENHLDGAEALAFARERKSFEEGDQERIKNQQRVLKGILDKITGSTAILTGYTGIMNSVGDEMQTNMSDSDIASLVRMQLEDLGGWDIQMISIKGTGTYSNTYSMGERQLYVVIPDEASLKAAQEAIDEVMR